MNNDRLKMLEVINELNDKLGFTGVRGEMYLTDDKLAELMNELKRQFEQAIKCTCGYIVFEVENNLNLDYELWHCLKCNIDFYYNSEGKQITIS